MLSKRAREAIPQELEDFRNRLTPFVSFPEHLVFIDETSKDGRDAYRKRAWSRRGTAAIVDVPFRRGKRVSILASMTVNGFGGFGVTDGTFTRRSFHDTFAEKILPMLNPWPLPNSIVIMDNAKIHMYQGIAELIHSRGAILFYLPPYSPLINPIELGFGLLKKWIQKMPISHFLWIQWQFYLSHSRNALSLQETLLIFTRTLDTQTMDWTS